MELLVVVVSTEDVVRDVEAAEAAAAAAATEAVDFLAKVRTGGLEEEEEEEEDAGSFGLEDAGSRMSPPTAKSANLEGALRARLDFTGASGEGIIKFSVNERENKQSKFITVIVAKVNNNRRSYFFFSITTQQRP